MWCATLAPRYMALTRLSLTEFRNHAAASICPVTDFIVLHGANGAGKTNILEAVSLLVPGRGLRRAAMADMARKNGNGGFTVSASIGDVTLGTGVEASAPERRKVRINGASTSINALAEWLAIIWLTPAMDRLFADSAGGRRRFLDRLVLAIDPAHARYSSRYEKAVQERNRLLQSGERPDPRWLDAVENAMAENAVMINASRNTILMQLQQRLATSPAGVFAVPDLKLDKPASEDAEQLQDIWRTSRGRDAAAGRTLSGPHRADLIVHHTGSGQVAALCSTGEQKALLLSTILAHADLVTEMRGQPPIILLDEVAAHIDPARRAALFERLALTGSQVWMTGTEYSLFSGLEGKAHFIEINDGTLS
jgi:DNA replication and repair protein RecF